MFAESLVEGHVFECHIESTALRRVGSCDQAVDDRAGAGFVATEVFDLELSRVEVDLSLDFAEYPVWSGGKWQCQLSLFECQQQPVVPIGLGIPAGHSKGEVGLAQPRGQFREVGETVRQAAGEFRPGQFGKEFDE